MSAQHYVSVFEPLLQEEARGTLMNAYEEVEETHSGMKWLWV